MVWGTSFSKFARLTEGGGGGLKLFGENPYTNTFQKGASLTLSCEQTTDSIGEV